jgi:hydroxymethylbilane synthase
MRIGTRGSKLALWQAHTVARLIQESGGPECAIVIIRTSGDEGSGPPDPPRPATTDGVPVESSDGPTNVKRLFVKEIEEALLDGRIDLAVHSSKDLPGELPAGLSIAAALEREDPRDAVLLPASRTDRGFDAIKAALGASPTIGTSSVRRVAQLRAVFGAATFTAIRGNVDTRLRKLDAGECDALVLAAAGVKRLGLDARLSALIPVDVCVPAPGQGIVAVEMADDAAPGIREVVRRISDADAETALHAERAVVKALGGGCQMPLGTLARLDGQDLTVDGVVASLDGRTILRGTVRGNRGNAAAAGDKLAAQLLAKGAGDLLK